jgi:hypothetical protein
MLPFVDVINDRWRTYEDVASLQFTCSSDTYLKPNRNLLASLFLGLTRFSHYVDLACVLEIAYLDERRVGHVNITDQDLQNLAN